LFLLKVFTPSNDDDNLDIAFDGCIFVNIDCAVVGLEG